MKNFIHRLVSLRNVVPLLIITGAFIGTVDPTILGLQPDQLLPALLAFLAIDALVERLELLNNIEQDIKILKKSTLGARDFLRYRIDFPRLETIINNAKKEIWVSGIGLDTMVTVVGVFQSKLKKGFKLRFLALDPDSAAIQESNDYFHLNREDLMGRVRNNLELLFQRLSQANDGQVQIRVIDHRPALGYFIVDPADNKGFMTVMAYLYRIQCGDQLPMFLLKKETDPHWFSIYLKEFQTLWDDAREWKPEFTNQLKLGSEKDCRNQEVRKQRAK